MYARNAKDENQEPDGRKWLAVQYHVRDREALESCVLLFVWFDRTISLFFNSFRFVEDFKNHAPAFRADGLARFGGKFEANRRVLEQFESFTANAATTTTAVKSDHWSVHDTTLFVRWQLDDELAIESNRAWCHCDGVRRIDIRSTIAEIHRCSYEFSWNRASLHTNTPKKIANQHWQKNSL